MGTANESKYIDWIEEMLKYIGYKTFREVIPDECKDWKYPYRVDLIFFKTPDKIYGMEAKSISSYRQAVPLSKAVVQIRKYRQLHYNTKTIREWCLSVDCRYKYNWNAEIKTFFDFYLWKTDKISVLHGGEYSVSLMKGKEVERL